jgi:transcription antitermination factor NusB
MSDSALVGAETDEGSSADARPDDLERGMALATAVWTCRDEADREISAIAREWPSHRQPVVDRNLLRMGWYELRRTDAPDVKVVSDAVELAKEFGTADSGKFVNGVLDKVMNAPAGGQGAS